MKFIKLTSVETGNIMFINVEQIIDFYSVKGKSIINWTNTPDFEVKETSEEILEKINDCFKEKK